MKLEKIEIKNYRSLFHDYDSVKSFEMTLGEGMNAIAGPNNVGKSNVLRALALALDPDFRFDRATDMPSPWSWSKPSVTLTFRVPSKGQVSREKTLLRNLHDYELKVHPATTKTYASEGIIKLRVTIEGAENSAGTRREVFVVRGGGARSLPDDDPVAVKAIGRFHDCFHFVMISSGQSLESLMEGKFRDILRNVLRENLSAAYDAAETSRAGYCSDLQTGLLKPLTERISNEVKELFPEISGVSLSPEVLTLDETLSKMRVRVDDIAATDLADKGTGVRGGLIIAMLRHFAEVGTRSMLFAVEEPESFLHPAAQEQLREDLEALSTRKDVSLLVTTHSPYIVSRLPGSKVFALDKDSSGRTVVKDQAEGSQSRAGVLGGLFRDRLFAEWLDRCASLDETTRLSLIVEGSTDSDFARLALERAGRADLLDGISFVEAGVGQTDAHAGGTALAIMQALLAQSVSSWPVAALFDNDEPGKKAEHTLREIGSKTGGWKVGKALFNYRTAIPNGPKTFPYEAEDLWPDKLLKDFIDAHPEADGGKTERPKPQGGWQYSVKAPSKGALLEHLRAKVTAKDCELWVNLFTQIRKGTGIDEALSIAAEPGEKAGSTPTAPPAVVPAVPRGPKPTAVAKQPPPSNPTPPVSPAAGQTSSSVTAPEGANPDKVTFLRSVRDSIAPGLEAAGFKVVQMHKRAAYSMTRFPSECGLGPADGHLRIAVTAQDASCSVVLHKFSSRLENASALEVVRVHYADRLPHHLPVSVDSWGSGKGEAVRAMARSVLPGGGYQAGDPATTAAWIEALALGWLELLRADPITDLAAEVALRGGSNR